MFRICNVKTHVVYSNNPILFIYLFFEIEQKGKRALSFVCVTLWMQRSYRVTLPHNPSRTFHIWSVDIFGPLIERFISLAGRIKNDSQHCRSFIAKCICKKSREITRKHKNCIFLNISLHPMLKRKHSHMHPTVAMLHKTLPACMQHNNQCCSH